MNSHDYMDKAVDAGLERLRGYFRNLKGALTAYSGGVDSALLAAAAFDALGERAVAVTVMSPSMPLRERLEAESLAKNLGMRHLVVEIDETADPDYRANSRFRCYHCKKMLFSRLKELAAELEIPVVIEGTNADDDAGDWRPGLRAVRELQVLSPYIDLKMGKAEIRRLAALRGLPVWDKPSAACLASRVAYGEEITPEKLSRIEKAEDVLLGLGFRRVRARSHGDLVRIETDPAELPRLLEPGVREKIAAELKLCGYVYVALDLEGYRTGAMNETADPPEA